MAHHGKYLSGLTAQLTTIRKKTGMTAKLFAELAELGTTQVYDLEHGCDSKLSTVERYARGLGLHIYLSIPNASELLKKKKALLSFKAVERGQRRQKNKAPD